MSKSKWPNPGRQAGRRPIRWAGPRVTVLGPLVLSAGMAFGWVTASAPAYAAGTSQVTVSPLTVFPTDQYFATTHALAGRGAVVTVTVGPNSVFRPYYPVEVMECDPHPVSVDDCDELTILTNDELTKQPVLARNNGSATVHFLLWSPLPDKWDPASVIDIGRGHPASLWIGDDPSNWATTGFVSSPISISSVPVANSGHPSADKARARPKQAVGPADPHDASSTRGHAGASQGSSVGTVVGIGAACLALGAAGPAVLLRRRRRPVTG